MPNPRALQLEQLETVFATEVAERVRTLNALLLRLEQDSGDDVLGPLGRELHNLKGAARAVGSSAIERLAHAAESAVLAVRQRGQRPEQAWFDGLYAAVDAFESLQRGTRPVDLERLLEGLEGPHPQLQATSVPIAMLAAAPQTVPSPEPEPARAAAQPIQAAPPAPITGSVRVAVGKLDTLLAESGELSVAHLRLAERLGELRALQRDLKRWQRAWRGSRPLRARLRRVEARSTTRDIDALLRLADQTDRELEAISDRATMLVRTLARNTSQLGTVAGAISQDVMAIRLLPVGTIFAPLERLARDLSRQTGKETRLVLSGTDTEIDRRVLDALRDPLMHMVRNTVDHGIESGEERTARGKPAHGTLRLAAAPRGDRVHITIEDDGRGLDMAALRAAAVRQGLLSAERAESLDAAAAINLIFHPGFSTRTTVTELSGRGVGLDVVRDQVERLGGTIRVQTTPGLGTTFTIIVPLTLATTRVLLVQDGGQTYAVPSSSIARTGRIRAADLGRLEGRPAVELDGRLLPVIELSDVLQRARGDTQPGEWRPFLVLPDGNRAVALLTDHLIDEQELVVKSLGAPLKRVRHLAGAAVLGTGEVVVILNSSDLLKTAASQLEMRQVTRPAEVAVAPAEAPGRRLLVVDDSVMTRTLERSILQAAGYEVLVAADGAQALEMLRSTPVDLVVSDVEMPRLTGIELVTAIRRDEALRQLPVVLVTSLGAPEQVEAGATAGANAYIVKGRFDQRELLETVGRLL